MPSAWYGYVTETKLETIKFFTIESFKEDFVPQVFEILREHFTWPENW